MSALDQEKLFYERFWALHNDPQLVEVFKRYGPEGFRRSSVLEGFERFIRETQFSGGVCVEIGTLKGLTALVLSRYFYEVHSFDIKPDPIKLEIREMLGVKNVYFYDVQDNEEKARLIRGLKFHAAYSDGDHAHDAASDFDLVKGCGRVLFHEFWDAQPAVVSLVKALPGSIKTNGKFALWTR